MARSPPLVIETRRRQMDPILDPTEVARLRRFGTQRSYAPGEALVKVGETGHGLFVIVGGQVEIVRRGGPDRGGALLTHGPGAFVGELAQLSGRAALVDAYCVTSVDAVVIPPERLRALLVAEAELGERIMRALILRRVGLLESPGAGPIIVGRPGDANALRLQGFLDRNGYPHETLDPDSDAEARALIDRFQVDPEALPIVLCPSGKLLRDPSETQLARCLGMVGPIDPDRLFDVAIVGAGPAGLAAAVYAASEGLEVLTLDRRAFGGQAGASARIENYLGFPTGISGMALMARANNQALKFGAEMAIPDQATTLATAPEGFRLGLANGEAVHARSVLVASGARYRRLDVAGLEAFEGASVHYWASPLEARLSAGQDVALVGAGNSAGQAAVYLAVHARRVLMVVRGDGLEASMSRYLVERLRALPNVEVIPGAEIVRLEGEEGALQAVTWRDRRSGEESSVRLHHLFLFIGADPNTDWLVGSAVRLNDKGFVLTGPDVAAAHPLETSLPGVFAIGDARCGSTKRVASAVGEGAQVVSALHARLAGQAASTRLSGRLT